MQPGGCLVGCTLKPYFLLKVRTASFMIPAYHTRTSRSDLRNSLFCAHDTAASGLYIGEHPNLRRVGYPRRRPPIHPAYEGTPMQNRWIHFAAMAGLIGWLTTNATAQNTQPWTLETARAELSWRPDDPYMRFVVAQLEHIDETGPQDPAAEARRQQRQQALMRSRNADLFNIFSGALAVQESLQLDAMTASTQADAGVATIATNSLQGPTVKSHPWEELLGGQTPDVSPLAMCVPADQLFVRFRSPSKLLQMQDLGEQYATYVTTQTKKRAYKANRIEEIQKQLALEVSPILSPVYDAAVAELAVTTSDLYFVDGNDITVIMQLRESRLLGAQLDMMLTNAMKANQHAVKQSGNYLGVSYNHVHSPDRSVHVYSAFPKPDLHVRSNSLAAMQRTISTILGKEYQGKTIEPLGATDEFKYIRTLMPLGDAAEDGIIYMSDAFIRKVIGPNQKLTQRARLICKSQLQMITFASLLYQTQYGQKPTSLEQLRARGCLGNADKPIELACPGGGNYTLADDGVRGCCSHHGSFHALKPANEVVRRQVTEQEAKEYQEFVQAYSQYWTTFFDPIAIRVQHDKKQTRVETIVLPLINNSIYQGLASSMGGEPEDLSPPRVTKSTVFSVAARINKRRLLPPMGIMPSEPLPDNLENDSELQQVEQAKQTLARLSLAMLNFESTMRHYPPKPRVPAGNEAIASGLSWRVQILPFLEEQELYNQFRQDEPWDSEHNRRLIAKMPDIFRIAPGNDAGKTRFVRPFHSDSVHNSHTKGIRIGAIADGTSNTILTVIADKDQAVVWTKPDDIAIDLASPRAGWSKGLQDHLLVGMADGSVGELRRTASDEQTRALITRAGGEAFDRSVIVRFDRIRPRRASRNPLQSMPGYEQLNLPEFLYKGIGNQVAVHVCDADPLIDFSVARFLGMVGGSFNGRGNTLFGETGMFAILAMSMNAPVYISVPITDTEIADRFLTKFDKALMIASQENSGNGFIEVELDSYRFADKADDSVRAFAFRFGPLTWRFYWSRIEDGLYIASKPNIIRELLAAGEGDRQAAASEPAHGSVRVRPKNWQAVLESYQIGWAESERLACLNNLGLLADLARAVNEDSEQTQLERLARQVFRAEYECPCGGSYAVDSDGARLHCSVHGSPAAPRQPSQTGVSAIRKLTQDLNDVQLQIQFLEDGLHATVTIKRD